MNDYNLRIERRHFPRYKISLPARFKFLDTLSSLVYDASTTDISSGGLAIDKAFLEKELSQKVHIEINLPEGQIIISSPAWVSWVRRGINEDRIVGLGMQFTAMFPEEKRKLDDYITKLTFPAPPRIKELRPPDFKLSDRERRNLEMLDVLRRGGLVSKSQISQELELNIVTISNYIEDFKRKGLVFERGFDESTGGRRPSLLELNSDYAFLLGAEVNFIKNYLHLALTDFTLRVLVKKARMIKEDEHNLHHSLMELIYEAVKESDVDRSRIVGMGLSFSGSTNDYDLHLKGLLEEKIGLPVLVEDSSVADIFAEKWLNLDFAKKENLLYLDINSTGVESDFSMILKGEVYRGASKARLKMSLNATRQEYQFDMPYCWLDKHCILRQEDRLPTLNNAQELGMRFGVRIAYLVNILHPDVVIVGNVPDEVQAEFFDALRSAMKRWAFADTVKAVKVIPAQLKEGSACLGMAALACRDIYSQI